MAVARHHKISRQQLNDLAALANTKDFVKRPFMFIPKMYQVGSESEMLDLAEADDGYCPGNVAIRSDTKKAYQLTDANFTSLASWQDLGWSVYDFFTDTVPPITFQGQVRVVLGNANAPWGVAPLVTGIGVKDANGTVVTNGYGGWQTELNRMRSEALAISVASNAIEFTDPEDNAKYITFRALDPSIFTNERFTFATQQLGGLVLPNIGNRNPYSDISFVFPEDPSCTLAWSIALNTKSVFDLDGNVFGVNISFSQSIVVRMKIAHSLLQGRLQGTVTVQVNNNAIIPFLQLTDPAGLVVSQTNTANGFEYRFDKTVGNGEYTITIINGGGPSLGGIQEWNREPVSTFTIPITTQEEVPGIHSTKRIFQIRAGDTPLFSTTAYRGHIGWDGSWLPATDITLRATGGTGGWYQAKTVTVSRLATNLITVINPHYILAQHSGDATSNPPVSRAIALEEFQRQTDGIGAPTAPFSRSPASVGTGLPNGTKISSVVVGRRGTIGTLNVGIGCIRNGQFVLFQTVSIPNGSQYSEAIFPDWIIFTGEGLAYDAPESLDVQSMIVGSNPGLYINLQNFQYPAFTGDNGAGATPLFAHFYNDTENLVNLVPNAP